MHQCVNLFWNPLNLTTRAFQRNAYLRAAATNDPDDAVVCILEIDLERLLSLQCSWTISPQNLARNEFTTFAAEQFTGAAKWDDGTPKCDWKSIFSVPSDKDRDLEWDQQTQINGKRSAEFIIHLGQTAARPGSVALPFEVVDRIIAPADAVRPLSSDQLEFLDGTGKTVVRLASVDGVAIYFSKSDLLDAELGFVKSANFRKRTDASVYDRANAALHCLEQFEQEHLELCPTRSLFLRSELADQHHGSMHAVRVMFWSAFLLLHFEDDLRKKLTGVSLVAASLHDTFREKDDEQHGQLAANAHRSKILAVFPDRRPQEDCLRAICFHGVPDENCGNMDFTLQILKDADALDRGRFAGPCYTGGCDPKYFRIEVLKNDHHHNIAWMAYHVAKITKYAPFDAFPCSAFTRFLRIAINSLHKK